MDILALLAHMLSVAAGVALLWFAAIAWKYGLSEASIRSACLVADWWWAAYRYVTSIFTVFIDPLDISLRAIPLNGSKRRLGKHTAFSLQAGDERLRRIAAWFYRWHREPSVGDWEHCCSYFGLADPPRHLLDLQGGEQTRIIVEIKRPGYARDPLFGNCWVYELTKITSVPRLIRAGACGVGDLTPSMIVNVEKWQETLEKMSSATESTEASARTD